MISSPYFFVLIIASVVVGIKLVERKSKAKFFEFVPSVVIIYFAMMLVGNIKLFDPTVVKNFGALKSYILPAMIFLMLLGSDIKSIYRIKTKLLVSFFVTSLSIMAGFVLMWAVMGGEFEHEAHKAFGALSGSWIGGTANMIAVAGATGLDGKLMGYCLITDSVCYAAWFAFLLFLTPHKDRFNAWTKAEAVTAAPPQAKHHANPASLDTYTVLAAIIVAFGVVFVSNLLPVFSFVTSSFWTVVLATMLGIAASFTPLSKSGISDKIGFWLLYFLIALIAAGSAFDDFSEAWLFVLAGFFVIATHAILITIYAKLFRIDLFTIGVASLANIGGVASAPLLAASFSKNLVSVGVIMSMLGYIIGTFCGLVVTYVLGIM
jgi:uncharacterized membrane protein